MKITATGLCMVLLLAMHATAQVDPPAVPNSGPESAPASPRGSPAAVPAQVPAPVPAAGSEPAATAAPATPPPAAGSAAAPIMPGAPPGVPVPVPPPTPAPSGDEIRIKSGAVLKGVQVLRRSPLGVEVQVTPEVTFFIPRKQVVEIKYDGIEPSKQRQVPKPAEPKQATFFGAKIEPAMSEKLNKPLPESCLKSAGRDLVDIMALISSETGVKIEVTDAVKSLAPNERQWDYTLAPGTTLTALLQVNLPERFTNLAIVYEYDQLVITTREAAAAQEKVGAETAPAPAPETQ